MLIGRWRERRPSRQSSSCPSIPADRLSKTITYCPATRQSIQAQRPHPPTRAQSHPFQMRVSADFLKSIDRWRHLTERLWEIRDVVEVPKAWEQSRAEKFSGDLVLTTRVLDACRPEQDALQRGHPAARGAWLVTRNKITGQISNHYLCPPDLQRKRSASV
jgi:hypothetical protein